MVVFDATLLMLAIQPEAGRPIDSSTREPVSDVAKRIAYLVEQLEKTQTKIGIPTPALSEALVRAGAAGTAFVEVLSSLAVFQILPFDELSAIEVAIMTRQALDEGDKRGGSKEVWSKIKNDRQIAGIARRFQASSIYTDDIGLQNTAKKIGLPTISLAQLALPPSAAQAEIEFPHDAQFGAESEEGFTEIDELKSNPIE